MVSNKQTYYSNLVAKEMFKYLYSYSLIFRANWMAKKLGLSGDLKTQRYAND